MTEAALGLEQDLTMNRGERYSQTPHSTSRVQMARVGYGILCSPSLPNKPTMVHAEMQQTSLHYFQKNAVGGIMILMIWLENCKNVSPFGHDLRGLALTFTDLCSLWSRSNLHASHVLNYSTGSSIKMADARKESSHVINDTLLVKIFSKFRKINKILCTTTLFRAHPLDKTHHMVQNRMTKTRQYTLSNLISITRFVQEC